MRSRTTIITTATITRRLVKLRTALQIQARHHSSSRTIQEHDVLLIRQRGERNPKWHLSSPLRLETPALRLSYGATLSPADLIGKRILDSVADSSGRECVLHDPSLSSYVAGSEREATPIYPHDATSIVSMLDLNLERPGESDYVEEEENAAEAGAEREGKEPFEIFEAGTGMGCLSMHVARAIHAGNAALPTHLRKVLASAKMRSDAPYAPTEGLETIQPWHRLAMSDQEIDDMKTYLSGRKAILHTLDNRRSHALAAHRFVRGFRRAQYLSDMDFHVGKVQDFVKMRLEEDGKNGGKPFLSRVILDLPQPSPQAEILLPAMKHSSLMVVFQPSISQIAAFASWAPPWLRLERVAEFEPIGIRTGEGSDPYVGGRTWDVRSTVVKKGEQKGEKVMVMRPKVGVMLGGGGFVGVWRLWPEKEGQRDEWTTGKVSAEELEEESREEAESERV